MADEHGNFWYWANPRARAAERFPKTALVLGNMMRAPGEDYGEKVEARNPFDGLYKELEREPEPEENQDAEFPKLAAYRREELLASLFRGTPRRLKDPLICLAVLPPISL